MFAAACLLVGTYSLNGRIDLPKNRPPEPLVLRFVEDNDAERELARSDVDANGRFQLFLDALPSAGLFKLDSRWLWIPGREQLWRRVWNDIDQPYFLHAAMGTALRGRVLPPPALQDRPELLVGSTIRLLPSIGGFEHSLTRAVGTDLSFAFERLDPEPTYRIQLEQPGFVTLPRRVEGTAPGAEATLELEALPSARVHGHVVSIDGRPVPDALVMLNLWISAEDSSGSALDWYFHPGSWNWNRAELESTATGTFTAADGGFELNRLVPGPECALGVGVAGFRNLRVPLGDLIAGADRSDMRIVLTPRAELEVLAVDERGRPVPDAHVEALDIERERAVPFELQSLEWPPDGPPRPPYTDAEGRAMLRSRREVKRALVDVRTDDLAGYFAEPVSLVDASRTQVTVVLHPAVPLTVQLVSKRGSWFCGDLQVFDERGYWRAGNRKHADFPGIEFPWGATPVEAPVSRDSIAGIQLAQLPPGTYTIEAARPDGSRIKKTFELRAGAPQAVQLSSDDGGR